MKNAWGRIILVGALVVGCNQEEVARAQADAEKAKAEAEQARLAAETAKAQAQAEVEKARASQAEAERGATAAFEQTRSAKNEARAAKEETARAQQAPTGPETVRPIVNVVVDERKPDGKSWDAMGGMPDLVVQLATSSGSVESAVQQDRLQAKVTLPPLTLKRGDAVRITVIDRDAMQSDLVGATGITYSGTGKSVDVAGGAMRATVEFRE